MLSHIDIQDFAIVKQLSLDFNKGLNIITGETGAGKSVIIEAISMALGSRADTAYVRTGSDKAVVSLLVDTDDCDLGTVLDDLGIPNDNPIVIRREISAQSKSICRINGAIVPLSSLNALCKKIADIHGQYDQQTLLDTDNHINILDMYGGSEILDFKDLVGTLYANYAEYSNSLYLLKKSISDSEKQKDFLRFELGEIQDAALCFGEDEQLEENIRLMQNSEKIYVALSAAHSALFDSDSSAASTLSDALSELQSVEGFSKDIDELSKTVADAYYAIDDINKTLRVLKDNISYSQAELDDSIERLELINKLKRKYGGSIESVLDYAAKAEVSINAIENADQQIADLEEKIRISKSKYDAAAERLSELRMTQAKKLEAEIDKELCELNFNNAHFKVDFEKTKSTANGIDAVEFLISANIGEDPKPLAKVASGGELSRVMLALKRIIGDIDRVPTMIFDEIDTGISGATAAVVGNKLDSISNNHQVLCITHLPQIACKGRSHYKIEKISDEISTHTTVVPLNKDERVEELARLLSGTEITQNARNQAMELLANE